MSGEVVHFEIPADDPDRAREFYSSVLGWKMSGVPELAYDMVTTVETDDTGMPTVPGGINGGMMRREGELRAPIVVAAVEDIDATLEKIGELGGSTVIPKQEVMGMGWNAYFRDPEGNIIGLWQNADDADDADDAGSAGSADGASAAAGNDIGA